MTDKIIFTFLVISLTACGDNITGSSWDINIEDYKCTDSQLDLVKKEFEICDQSSYVSAYCFATAKKLHCEKVVK